jgi:predicted dehydrogenase
VERVLRVGIAGGGFIGGVHARAARVAGARVVGVAASSPERGAQAAIRLGAERAYDSAEELAEADEIDVVHVCTPNDSHVRVSQRALAAGKHVVCEKPLAPDLEGALALTAAAANGAADRCAAVPFVYRYYPTIREARERVKAGAGGAVRLMHGTYLQDWLMRAEDDNWRVHADKGGASRAFADIGSHWCDLAEFASGQRIVRVCARLLTALPERVQADDRKAFTAPEGSAATAGDTRVVTTEDAAVVQFETDGGAIGSVVVSQISAGRKNRLWLELDCAEESLAFDQESPETLWCGRREATTIVRRDPTYLSEAAARFATLPAGHPQGYADCFDAFVADVYSTVRTGVAPDGLPKFEDGLRAAVITDAVLASAREGGWLDVPAHAPLAVTP